MSTVRCSILYPETTNPSQSTYSSSVLHPSLTCYWHRTVFYTSPHPDTIQSHPPTFSLRCNIRLRRHYESGMCTLSTQNLDDTHWLQSYIIQSVDCPLRLFFFSPWSIQALCTCCLICPPGISCPHENRNILPTYRKTGISCLQENMNIQALCICGEKKPQKPHFSPRNTENRNILPTGIQKHHAKRNTETPCQHL